LGPGDFSYPRALSAGRDGRVYVVDKSARVQRFSPDGQFELGWTMPEKQSGKPVGLHVADDGRVFVADTHYHRVIVYSAEGTELAQFGRPGQNDGEFELPTDVAIDADGNVYVSEYNGNDRITKWTPDFRFIKSIGRGEVDGLPLRRPAGIDIDTEQTLWVADACNHRVIHFDLEGNLLGVWGEMGRDAGQMRYPYDITCAPDGSIMVCEYGNDRLQWFDRDGRSLRVWGQQGRHLGDLWAPWGATYGPDGRVYVVDSLNARVQILRL
jgi:DNA-binding beta-propeller fold protein YncE